MEAGFDSKQWEKVSESSKEMARRVALLGRELLFLLKGQDSVQTIIDVSVALTKNTVDQSGLPDDVVGVGMIAHLCCDNSMQSALPFLITCAAAAQYIYGRAEPTEEQPYIAPQIGGLDLQ